MANDDPGDTKVNKQIVLCDLTFYESPYVS